MFTNNKLFELTHLDAEDKQDLTRNRAAFVKQMERPLDEVDTREVISSCAGKNYEAHGRIVAISTPERYVWGRLNHYLQTKAD
jgi:hypothetical protein